jgi:hypothetical protein
MEQTIIVMVNPNQKVYVVNTQMFYVADETGTLTIKIPEHIYHEGNDILEFEHKIETMLTEDQRYDLYNLLATSKGITVSRIIEVLDILKKQAKEIITLALRYHIVTSYWNNTVRVTNKAIKERMEQHVINRYRQHTQCIGSETIQETITKLRAQGLLGPAEVNETEGKQVANEESSEKVTYLSNSSNSNSVKLLQDRLKVLEKKLQENTNWNEEETPWTVNNEINQIKSQLRILVTTSKSQSLSPSDAKPLPKKKSSGATKHTRKPR